MKFELSYLRIAGNGELPQERHFAVLYFLGFLFVAGFNFLV